MCCVFTQEEVFRMVNVSCVSCLFCYVMLVLLQYMGSKGQFVYDSMVITFINSYYDALQEQVEFDLPKGSTFSAVQILRLRVLTESKLLLLQVGVEALRFGRCDKQRIQWYRHASIWNEGINTLGFHNGIFTFSKMPRGSQSRRNRWRLQRIEQS